MKRTLVVDNYDSFTYNLVHLLRELGAEADVQRNDEIADVHLYDQIVLSPGPGIPSEAGSLLPLIREFAATKKFLGVCLGHQAIGEIFGGRLLNTETVYHGVATDVRITDLQDPIFRGVPTVFSAGRYHSWVVTDLAFPLIPTAVDDRGTIMAMRHAEYPIFGVQFHPESVLTPCGKQILKNWLEI